MYVCMYVCDLPKDFLGFWDTFASFPRLSGSSAGVLPHLYGTSTTMCLQPQHFGCRRPPCKPYERAGHKFYAPVCSQTCSHVDTTPPNVHACLHTFLDKCQIGVLWAVLRVASMFRQSRTHAFIRLIITSAAIVTEVCKRAFLLLCETGSQTNVSALSASSPQLYRNTNVFGLKRLVASASKVQQLDVNIQSR